MHRKQEELIVQDLRKKMVFLSGPRQVGKTFLSKEIAQQFKGFTYLNYDSLEHRKIIQTQAWLPKNELLIFDEIHKMPDWKNFIKGVYDSRPQGMCILVTGSARLEAFRGMGDSLAGRYFRHQLLPLTLSEIAGQASNHEDFNAEVCLENLMQFGEFPEPYLTGSVEYAERWRSFYIDGLIREDILDFEKVRDFKKIQLTLELLRSRVGSPVSYSALAEDVQAAPNTIRRYIEIFEALYIIFRVSPYSKNIARSILKEPKIYFFDTGMVKADEGIKFENHVALSLFKQLKILEYSTGKNTELQYLRTKDGKEMDFCRVISGEIQDAFEIKLSKSNISPSTRYFQTRYQFDIKQIVRYLETEKIADGIPVLRASDFLKQL
jgi:predicted AAA+ superfamily ATPase